MISYDPDEKPKMDMQAFAAAKKQGLHPVHVICEENPNAKVGDPTGVSFWLFVDFVPRIGDTISLEDKKKCRVKHVLHQVVTSDSLGGKTTVVNIVADRVHKLE